MKNVSITVFLSPKSLKSSALEGVSRGMESCKVKAPILAI